ncbi:S-adenosyl-L-methionine-dependent methyltransferase [Sarocladium strictum]
MRWSSAFEILRVITLWILVMASTSAEAPTTVPKAASKSPSRSPQGQHGAIGPEITIDPEHELEDESDYNSDNASSTASLTESVMDYRRIHGRTFHNYKTDTEYCHEMLLLAMDNKLTKAPIDDNIQKVLDIGTGTGIWAVDFADQYPSAEVIGTDISPTQSQWVPPNCKFELEDCQLAWTYPDNSFDFIHARLMMGSIKDWNHFYSEVYRCLKPGGWFEHVEYDPSVICDDGSISEDSPLKVWGGLFMTSGDIIGQTFNIIVDSRNVGWMKDAGFQQVDETRLKLPLGPWAKKPELKVMGNLNLTATEAGLEGFALYLLTNVLQWDLAKTQTYLAGVRKELRSKSVHSYYFW